MPGGAKSSGRGHDVEDVFSSSSSADFGSVVNGDYYWLTTRTAVWNEYGLERYCGHIFYYAVAFFFFRRLGAIMLLFRGPLFRV